MLTAQRKDHLLALLDNDGRVVAKDVAAELGISEDSVRRDLRELAAAGLCQRVYGGALRSSPAARPYEERLDLATESKERVARAAIRLIRPGSTIILDAGTTTLAMARMLPAELEVTVITPSPLVAVALAEHPLAEVFLIGGRLSRHSMVTGGALALEAIRHLRADQFFMGVTGVHPEAGLTTGDLDDAATKRALAAQASETYVLASREKIGVASAFPVIERERVAGVIVDPETDFDAG
jgi:DeoR/GlpR family transcriptional regulator of sugar metabolism